MFDQAGEAPPRGPLRRLLLSFSSLVATLIEIGETRLSLLATELQAEVDRAIGFILYAIAAIFLAAVGVVMASFALVVAYWDSHRLLVSLLVSGALLTAAFVIVLVLAARLRSRPPVLEGTLAELKRDRQALTGEP